MTKGKKEELKSQDQRARMGAWRGNVYGGAEQILFVISLRFPLSSLRHDLHQKKKGLHLPRNLILLHFLLFLLDQILFFFLGSGSFSLSTRISATFLLCLARLMTKACQHAPRTTHEELFVRLSLLLWCFTLKGCCQGDSDVRAVAGRGSRHC